MTHSKRSSLSPQIQSTIGAIFSVLLLLIAISHLAAFAETGITSVLLFSLAEIVIAVLFLLRMPLLQNGDDADPFDADEPGVRASARSSADMHDSYSRC